MFDDLDERAAREYLATDDLESRLTGDWFHEQRAFYDSPAQLIAVIKGRRAGGTKAGCSHFVRQAATRPGTRLLYLNSTRGEARQIAWYGLKDDGVAALCERYKIPCNMDGTRLEIRFANGSVIQLRGADDEAELRKALGLAYDEVWWDEAQKIPPRLAQSIREVLMPALLERKGKLRLVGTPVRQMSGLFFDVTKPDLRGRLKGWSVHHWTLLDNVFFGSTRDARHKNGMVELQKLLGGPEVAPMDGPIMQREGFGRWVAEDSNFVYAVHRTNYELFYAPARHRDDGFVDVSRALDDLPGESSEYIFSLGVDLGYRDPFAVVLWGYHPAKPEIFEVASWKKSQLTADDQIQVIREIRKHVTIGQIVADAAGIGKEVVVGWSKEWIDRYNLPITEAKKNDKNTAITLFNNDLLTGRMKLRENGDLYDELSKISWSTQLTGNGQPTEDKTIPNDVADAALYAHRHSYPFRFRSDPRAPIGKNERLKRQQDEMLELADELNDPRSDLGSTVARFTRGPYAF